MLDELDCLVVVFEFDVRPVYTFFCVLLLFLCKHVLIKLLLQLFVRVVDAQLFKTIFHEDFKAKNIEKADEVV